MGGVASPRFGLKLFGENRKRRGVCSTSAAPRLLRTRTPELVRLPVDRTPLPVMSGLGAAKSLRSSSTFLSRHAGECRRDQYGPPTRHARLPPAVCTGA